MSDYLIVGLSVFTGILISIITILIYKLRKNNPSSVSKKSKDENSIVPVQIKQSDKLTNVTAFEAIKDDKSIRFDKMSIIDMQNIKNYNYIEIAKSVLSSTTCTGTQVATITALNPNGLFTATTCPSALTHFKDGTISTMVHGPGGRITEHAGFQSISSRVFTPIIGMQVLSFATGQYYLNGLVKQLNSIDKKMDKLINFHHTEQKAKLECAQSLLKKMCEIKKPDMVHLAQLKHIEFEVGTIYRQYFLLLENIKVDPYSEGKIEYLRNLTRKIGMDSPFLLIIQKIADAGDLNDLKKIEADDDFSLNIYMLVSSEEILRLIEMVEFILKIRMGENIEQINELYEAISKWEKTDFYSYTKAPEKIEKYFNALQSRAQKLLEKTTLFKSDEEEYLKSIKEKKESISKDFCQDIFLYDVKEKLVEQMNMSKEVLYYVDENNNSRVFIKQ